MAICVFSTISCSIVKCSFVCLFVVALDPCKINIEKYTNVVLSKLSCFILTELQPYPYLCACVFVCLSVCVCV